MRIFKFVSVSVLALGLASGAYAQSLKNVQSSTSGSAVSHSQLIGPEGVNRKITEANTLKPPRGFKAVWDDGRLNPLRGTGTLSGKVRMHLIWSETVPRYLIDPATGEPATRRQIRLFGG